MLIAFPVIGVAVAGRSRLLDSFVYDSDGLRFSWRIALLSNGRMPVALQPLARFSGVYLPSTISVVVTEKISVSMSPISTNIS